MLLNKDNWKQIDYNKCLNSIIFLIKNARILKGQWRPYMLSRVDIPQFY